NSVVIWLISIIFCHLSPKNSSRLPDPARVRLIRIPPTDRETVQKTATVIAFSNMAEYVCTYPCFTPCLPDEPLPNMKTFLSCMSENSWNRFRNHKRIAHFSDALF